MTDWVEGESYKLTNRKIPQNRCESHLCHRSESHPFHRCESDLFWGYERVQIEQSRKRLKQGFQP